MKDTSSMVWTTLQICLLVVAALSACSSKKKDEATTPGRAVGRNVPGDTKPGAAAAATPGHATDATADAARRFGPIYFSYDGTELADPARAELQRAGEYLGLHPAATLVIAGHADERGTPEYNLALGQERARVVGDYLRRLGVDEGRLRLVSYGEEQPAVEGEGEASWAKNRRAELELSR